MEYLIYNTKAMEAKMRVRTECVISTDSWVYPLGIVKLITNRNRFLDEAGEKSLLAGPKGSHRRTTPREKQIYDPFKTYT